MNDWFRLFVFKVSLIIINYIIILIIFKIFKIFIIFIIFIIFQKKKNDDHQKIQLFGEKYTERRGK